MKNVLSRGRKRKRRRRRKKVQGTNNTQTSNVTDEVQRSEAEKRGDKEYVDKTASSSGSSASTTQHRQEKHWKNLKKYLDVNDHMKGVDHGKYAPKSGMEKQLDEAVAAGDFEKAEEISDQLSQRDLASRIAKAADARDYMSWKKVQQERKEANRKKKQKLAWGFEPKERWQMKGNM